MAYAGHSEIRVLVEEQVQVSQQVEPVGVRVFGLVAVAVAEVAEEAEEEEELLGKVDGGKDKPVAWFVP